MYGLVGSRIGGAGSTGATRRAARDTKTTIFVDPAAPGSAQNSIFVDPMAPGRLQTTISIDPAPPSILQWPPGALGSVWKGSKMTPKRVPMPSKTFPEPLRNHWDELRPNFKRLQLSAGNRCLQILPGRLLPPGPTVQAQSS